MTKQLGRVVRPITPVLIAIDASGSMYGVRDDVIGGFNSYIDELKNDRDHAYRVTLVLFNDQARTVFTAEKPEHVRRLGDKSYAPRGSTALLDAIGTLVSGYERDEAHKPPLVVIHTDGKENASREWSSSSVKSLVERRKAEQWGFMFLGAGIDNWQQGDGLGFYSAHTVETREGTQGLYSGLTSATRYYAGGGSAQSATQIVGAESHKEAERGE